MIHTSVKRNGQRRAGGAAVEFAVVAPLLFLMVFGVIELGRGYMIAHFLSDTARAGCRTAVLTGKTNSNVENVVDGAVKAYGLKNTTTKILVNGVETNASTAKTGDEITVVISVPVKDVTWMPGSKYLPGNMTGEYRLRRE